MGKAAEAGKHRLYVNRLYYISIAVCGTITCIFTIILSYYSYKIRMNEILQENMQVFDRVIDYYDAKHADFHLSYIPILSNQEYKLTFMDFFSPENDGEEMMGDMQMRKKLSAALKAITSEDLDIVCILLRRESDDDIGYLFLPTSGLFEKVGPDFPYLAQLQNNRAVRQIFPEMTLTINRQPVKVFAISGGVPVYDGVNSTGDMLICYRSNVLDAQYRGSASSVKYPPAVCIATMDGRPIYNSDENASEWMTWTDASEDRVETVGGRRFYTRTLINTKRGYKAGSVIPYDQLFYAAHRNTVRNIGIAFAVVLMLIISCKFVSRPILRRVETIRNGLETIGQNHLDYRIPCGNQKDEFGAITRSINEMAEQLEQTVDKLYVYQLKQKTAEMGELQAKFNPHFLYNTLAVICARAYENEDSDVAEMLVLLSKIFRSFINDRTFITIREEIMFCDMYLELFRMRYKGNIQIEFDIKNCVMNYGIIRNLLQPIVENYFVHGFRPQAEDNRILISAGMPDAEHILLSVADNGAGMTEEAIHALNHNLEPSEKEDNGYGLRNLHDRIRLFYGPECGFRIEANEGGGIRASIVIRRMTPEEHEEQMKG